VNKVRLDVTKVQQFQCSGSLRSRLHRDAFDAENPIKQGLFASGRLSATETATDTRAVSSEVERLLYTQDVGGSIPSPPTSRRAYFSEIIERDDGRYQIGAVRMTARSQAISVANLTTPTTKSTHAALVKATYPAASKPYWSPTY
jgi:hypothetical protein